MTRTLSYLLIGIAVAACERTETAPGAGKRPPDRAMVMLIGPAATSHRWMGIHGGARQFILEFPMLRLGIAAPSDNGSEAILREVRKALSRRPDVICLYVSDPDTAGPAAREIVQHGAILVTMGVDADVPGVFGHVRVDFTGGAGLLGEHLTEIAAGKRSYFLLHNEGASVLDTRCYERFMQRARSHRGITLLEERNVSQEERLAAELLTAMFARFRHAGLVVTLDPTPWLSRPPAELLGRNARFATLSAVPSLWRHLRTGEAAALVGQLDGEIGSFALEIALAALTESEEPGLVRNVRSALVTRETLEDFAQRYAEAAGCPVSSLLAPSAASQPAAGPRPVVEP